MFRMTGGGGVLIFLRGLHRQEVVCGFLGVFVFIVFGLYHMGTHNATSFNHCPSKTFFFYRSIKVSAKMGTLMYLGFIHKLNVSKQNLKGKTY